MTCEYIVTCGLINQKCRSIHFTVSMMKIKYCQFNKYGCARYLLMSIFDMDDIPNDLWPGDEIRGLQILEMKQHESRQKLYGRSEEEIPV